MGHMLAWAAAGLLAAGLVVGFVPVSSQGVSCGSPYAPASASDIDAQQGYCDEVLSLVRAPALALTITGGAVLLGVLASRGPGVDMRGHRMVLGRPVRRRTEDG